VAPHVGGDGPEIIIALVGALGSDLNKVGRALREELQGFSYQSDIIKLSWQLSEVPNYGPYPSGIPEDERYEKLMKEGTRFREELNRADALAQLGVLAIRNERAKLTGNPMKAARRHAYIFHSLKNPAEVDALRSIYGRAFFLLAAYSPRDQRESDFAERIANSRNAARRDDYLARATELISKDDAERDKSNLSVRMGQNVRDVFPAADAFIDAGDPSRMRESVRRVIEILFGVGFHTPSRDEQGMFFAKAAALRSASLARQVGAAVTTREGDLVALGTNEVPKAGGGLYWENDEGDDRAVIRGKDVSDEYRRRLVGDVLEKLQEGKWLTNELSELPLSELVKRALKRGDDPGPMRRARIMDVMEFVREAHAEMAALAQAAQRGLSVAGCTLYVTTYPCHECARLLVAAGIKRVVYVEPYPKSLAAEFYPSAIEVEHADPSGRFVSFEPFIGIAPRRYLDAFEVQEERKDKDTGEAIVRSASVAEPRVPSKYRFYLLAEEDEAKAFAKLMEESRQSAQRTEQPPPHVEREAPGSVLDQSTPAKRSSLADLRSTQTETPDA
jgi:cytidine deaminase